MCGIYACIKCKKDLAWVKEMCNKIQHRGPDYSTVQVIDDDVTFGFHRLAIVDTSVKGNQPFSHNGIYLICNGEIFNHKMLEVKNSITHLLTSESDCECIMHLYEKNGIDRLAESLDAEFAFVLYDSTTHTIHAARDAFGVRPLFIGFENNEIYFASEMKAINNCDYVTQFLPGRTLSIDLTQELNKNVLNDYKQYYFYPVMTLNSTMEHEEVSENIRQCFIEAVKKRTMSERVVGCLLSGGLDSSMVASVLYHFIPSIQFFSIGLKDSVDVKAAKRVVEYLGAPKEHHHIIEFTVEEGMDAIEQVIKQIESYDITTIRASTPQYLMAKYIATKTDVIVIYSGEGSDELNAGYQYSKNAPNAMELWKDSKRLLSELYMYDNLRTDRTMSGWGLEVRVPFLDKDLVDFILSVDPRLKMCNKQIEKKLFRDAFVGHLPDDILYRPKEAFSDAVSSKEKSWYKSLQAMINTEITDDELANHTFTVNPPKTKEALYYRKIFAKYYPNRDNVIEKYWMPQWQDPSLTDPSATVLECHKGDLE